LANSYGRLDPNRNRVTNIISAGQVVYFNKGDESENRPRRAA